MRLSWKPESRFSQRTFVAQTLPFPFPYAEPEPEPKGRGLLLHAEFPGVKNVRHAGSDTRAELPGLNFSSCRYCTAVLDDHATSPILSPRESQRVQTGFQKTRAGKLPVSDSREPFYQGDLKFR